MLKKIVLTAALIAGSLPAVAYAQSTPTPMAASTGKSTLLNPQGFNNCLLTAGCVHLGNGQWYCSDPAIFAECKVDEGGGRK